ncbi:MAG: phosphatidylserine decarboxylase [Gammaproteobacteria bacterium]
MAVEYPYIARQGWPFILAAVLVALVLHFTVGEPWSLPFWLLALVLLYLFRDPTRRIPPAPLGVVSPVDGKVTAVESCRDPYLQRDAVRIGLRMQHFGVYTTRSPVEGKIMDIWFFPAGSVRPGEAAVVGDASHIDRYAIWLQTDEQDDVVLVIRVTEHRLRPRCYVHIGERIGQGQRCGMVGFGGEVNVYVPANSRIEVQPGSRVRAGSDIVATLVH